MTISLKSSDDGPKRIAPVLTQFSTDAIERPSRLEYWIDALGKAYAPVVVSSEIEADFSSFMTGAELDVLGIVHASGSQQVTARTKACQSADTGHTYHLMADFGLPWWLNRRGETIQIRPGDLVLTDSRQLHTGGFLDGCALLNVRIPPVWASAWLKEPERFSGLRIDRDVGWGAVLSAFAAQLSPQMAVNSPLPPLVIAQNLGALLSMVEAEMIGQPFQRDVGQRQTVERVRDIIRQRANESGLTALDVANTLQLSERTVHRSLTAAGDTFGATLIQERMDLAKRMLEARHFDRLTIGEIGSRAGFADPSHFVRTATRYLHATPARYRSEKRR